jgi:DNA-binding MarR family transcriptional regulator
MAIRRLDSLGYQLSHLRRLYERRFQDALQGLGVAPGQFAPLVMLFEQDGLSQAELCRRINVEQPTMANTLDRMERDGLVRREADPRDKRRVAVFLTPKAAEMRTQVMDRARKVAVQAVQGLTVAERDQLFALLSRIADNLKDPSEAATAPSSEHDRPKSHRARSRPVHK